MSSDLERRLEGLLADAPEPEPGAGEEALQRALHALRPAAPSHRGLRTAVLVFAGTFVLLAIAAGSLAAAGAIHVSFGAKKKSHPVALAATQLTLPKGAKGVAAIVDGRLSVVIKGGFRLQQPATAAALSPHALYVAAGIGHSLVAMAPSGRKAWSHPAGGRVVEIAWAPYPTRIAYVVHAGHQFVLHLIWGTGTHDTVIDRGVRAVRPSWRADSLALAYVGGGGHPVVYDLEHRTHSVVGSAAPVTHVAFAPVGKTLTVATPTTVLLDGNTVATGRVEALGWFDDRPAAALGMRTTSRVRTFGTDGRPVDNFVVPGKVVGLSGGLVVTRTTDRLLAGWREKTVSTLLGVPRMASVEDLAIG
jgi:hypothetical protein